MKATPKLQDTLEVFLERLDSLQSSFGTIWKANSELDDKITRLKQIRISPDLEEFSALNAKFQKSHIQNLEDITKIQNNHIDSLKSNLRQNVGRLKLYYLLTFCILIIGGISIFFASKYYLKSEKLVEDNYYLNKNNNAMLDFIKDNNQVEKYNRWFEKNKEK